MPAPPRVALVHSPPHGEVDFLNIGLAYLQAVLEKHGCETTCHDICFAEHHAGTDFYDDYVLELGRRIGGDVGDGVDPRLLLQVVRPRAFDRLTPIASTILDKVERHLPRVCDSADVFLFSVNVLTQYFASALAARLRAMGKRTAAGGPNLGFAPLRRLLLLSGAFDAVAQGDGEGLVVDLATRLAERVEPDLPGVSWLDARGEIRESPPAPALPIDALPIPSFRGMTFTYFVPILASRGCPRRCAFCSETSKERYRQRAPEAVVAEMQQAPSRYRHRNFHFHDDLVNASPAWIDSFCSLLREGGERFTWESFCGPEGLTPARLETMAAAGCVLLKLGVQSFSDHVLGLMRRRSGAGAIRQAIVHGDRIGISMRYDMLTCFPGETDDDHRRNLEQIEAIFAETKGVHFSPNPFYLSIGSETHLRHEAFGISLEHFDPDTLPVPLAGMVRACGSFPVGFRYGIAQQTVRQRMRDLGEILRRHGKDYLYLGQPNKPARQGPSTYR
jgi:hypothetical protein